MCPVNTDPFTGKFVPVLQTTTVISSDPEINSDASSFQLTVFTHPPCFSRFFNNRMPLIIDGCFMHCVCVHCL